MFEQSTEINELITALILAKLQMDFPGKSSKGQFGKYADLTDYINAIEPHLLPNGLVFMQPITDDENGMRLTSILAHKSGQYMRSSFRIQPEENSSGRLTTLQEEGKAITYLKRYAASAIFFRAGVDDDNDGATSNKQTPDKKPFVKWIDKDKVAIIRSLMATKGDQQMEQKVCDHYKIENLFKLPEDKYEELIKLLKVSTS